VRTLIFAAYFMGAGYLIAKTDLDEDLARVAQDVYRGLVKHTVATVRDVRRELDAEPIPGELA
jgi:hypothetical protein